jgi:hypothetical protein
MELELQGIKAVKVSCSTLEVKIHLLRNLFEASSRVKANLKKRSKLLCEVFSTHDSSPRLSILIPIDGSILSQGDKNCNASIDKRELSVKCEMCNLGRIAIFYYQRMGKKIKFSPHIHLRRRIVEKSSNLRKLAFMVMPQKATSSPSLNDTKEEVTRRDEQKEEGEPLDGLTLNQQQRG